MTQTKRKRSPQKSRPLSSIASPGNLCLFLALAVVVYVASSAQTGRIFERQLQNLDEKKAELSRQEGGGDNTDPSPETPFGRILGASRLNLRDDAPPPPELSAASALVLDLDTNQILYAKNPHLPHPPASTTKMLTALVALETFDLNRPVSIPPSCTRLPGNRAGFLGNEVVTVESLIYGLLVVSGADAACALANLEGNEIEFVEKMNQRAEELDLKQSYFTNPIGFDSQGIEHLSSAWDLAKIAIEATKNNVFRKIMGTREVTLESLINQRLYHLENTNRLLRELPGTTGVKTGFTEGAQGCLVFTYQNQDWQILSVVLGAPGSDNRFEETKALLDWVLNSYLPD